MGIFDFWKTEEEKAPANPNGGVAHAAAQGTASNSQSSTPSAQTTQQAGGSVQVAAGLQNAQDNPAAAPFADLWQLDEEQRKKLEKQQLEIFGADVTPEKIFEAARQIDFTKNVPPELMEKVLAGDQTALLSLINGVGQSAYAQSSVTAKTASETAVHKLQADFEAKLPELIRSHSQRNSVAEDNPLATNPATKPMFDMLLGQMQAKYPQATTQQLKEHTTNYMKQFITAAGGKLPEAETEETTNGNKIPQVIKGDDSWSNFFN